MGQLLPGDGHGRECFDTFPTFVVGDPSARFYTHTPLTYETTGEIGHSIWKDIFRHILKEGSYLSAFDTVYVMVDTRNLRAHGTTQDGYHTGLRLWHGGIVGCSLLDHGTRRLNSFSSRPLNKRVCIVYTRHGLVHLLWLPWLRCSLASTSSCWTATVYR